LDLEECTFNPQLVARKSGSVMLKNKTSRRTKRKISSVSKNSNSFSTFQKSRITSYSDQYRMKNLMKNRKRLSFFKPIKRKENLEEIKEEVCYQ